jgi:thiamine pyrophosphokinase
LTVQNFEQYTLLDGQNRVHYLKPGTHALHRRLPYKYIGFVQVGTDWTLELTGARYPLKAEDNFADIYASNEFVENTMTVRFDKGALIVIYSKDA